MRTLRDPRKLQGKCTEFTHTKISLHIHNKIARARVSSKLMKCKKLGNIDEIATEETHILSMKYWSGE